jgi:hypothetical protein
MVFKLTDIVGIKGVKYCGIGEIDCYQSLFQRTDIHQLMSACDCLPGCTSLTYDAEIYQGHFHKIYPGRNIRLVAIFRISFLY